MAIDLKLLSDKIRKIRENHGLSLNDVVNNTGISIARASRFEDGTLEPTGDEILILSDLYKCDFRFFISNEKITSLEKTERLFRILSEELTAEDRLSVSEFFFLCESEQYLRNMMGIKQEERPSLSKAVMRGSIYKEHGKRAGQYIRQLYNIPEIGIIPDVYYFIRSMGIHVFRRRLCNSKISGMYIMHPDVGDCILINYEEDTYRQRFSAIHELAHSLFDSDLEIMVSGISKWPQDKLREIRADNFAASFLCPPSLINSIPDPQEWNKEKAIDICNKIKVNTTTLAIALKNGNLINDDTEKYIRAVRIPKECKEDPEIHSGMPGRSKVRMRELLEMGLSRSYVNLCFTTYYEKKISLGKLAEMLLSDVTGLQDIAELFGIKI
jgi:Zn-dependent peptidase ImmA (M78 family)/transcriptional regulator with XRE-family HTH domain